MKNILAKTGGGGLGTAFYRFFSTHMGFLVFTSLHGTFMNTLLMRVTGGSDAAMKFNIIVALITGPILALAAALAKRTSIACPMQVGVVMYLLMYGVFFLMFDRVDAAMPLLAVLSGLGAGFYWYGFNMGMGCYLNDENRDRGFSIVGVGAEVVALAVPFFSGLVISSFEGLTGYLVVFGMGLIVAAVTVVLSMRVVRLNLGDRQTHYRETLRAVFRDPGMPGLYASTFVKGIRMGTLMFFLNLLLYEAVESEFIVGFSGTLSALLGIFGAIAYGRLITKKNRFRSMYVATTVLAAGALALLVPGAIPVMAFAMLNTFFSGFLINPTGGIFHAAIELPEYTAWQGEFNGIRETALSVGKALGIAFTMYFSDLLSPAIAILILTLLQYPMIVLQIPIQRVLDKRNG
ncbi:MAG: MFS transporter [Oscillospiraceae bacterium]|nr:MFS transporter [Oscillospiraceae bacterium]